MATAEFKATIETTGGARASGSGLIGTTSTDATAADTAVGVVVTDNTTTLAAIDTFGAAIVAITGDSYTAHQFAFDGATGLTHAQVATNFALLNTAITAFLAGQTATTAAKTATALVVTDAAAVDSGADVTVRIGSLANVPTKNKLRAALDAIFRVVQGSNLLTD